MQQTTPVVIHHDMFIVLSMDFVYHLPKAHFVLVITFLPVSCDTLGVTLENISLSQYILIEFKPSPMARVSDYVVATTPAPHASSLISPILHVERDSR